MSIAFLTRAASSGLTYFVPFITWDTVASDTPAAAATSFRFDILVLSLPFILVLLYYQFQKKGRIILFPSGLCDFTYPIIN